MIAIAVCMSDFEPIEASPNPTMTESAAMSKLTNEEISCLQWLRENGGRRAVSGNNDLSGYGRVVASGYVDVRPNRFSADTVYLTITNGGRKILESAERHALR